MGLCKVLKLESTVNISGTKMGRQEKSHELGDRNRGTGTVF